MAPRIGQNRPAVRPKDSAPADAAKPSKSTKPPALPKLATSASTFEVGKAVGSVLVKLGLGGPPTPSELVRNDRQRTPSPEVKDFQGQLNQWRADHAQKGIKDDGFFGPKTEAAVKAFQKASGLPPTGRAGPGLQTRLAVENDPSFKKLNDDTKKALRTQLTAAADDPAKLQRLKDFATAPGLSNLAPAHQQKMVDALARHPDDASLAGALGKLANSPTFAGTSDATKASLIETLRANAPATSAKVDGALALVGSPQFAALSDPDKALATAGLAGAKADPQYAASVKALVSDPKFQALGAAEKTAVLSQVKNYPDVRTADNVKLALQKDWFTGQTLADKQRSLQVIGRLSTYAGGDRAVIDNTLNKFLSPTSDYKLVWKDYPTGGTSTTYGEAADKTLWLNRGLIAANDNKMAENSKTNHLTLSTTPHEVNHLLNGDKVAKTYKYFEAEYRAWYVGFKAENGRAPNNQEAMEQRLAWQLNPTSFYGKYATEALKDPKEAQKFYDLIGKMSGQKVDASNWSTVIASDASKWPDASKSAPVPAGNVNNG